MSQIFVWRPRDVPLAQATARFAAGLERRRDRSAAAYGRRCVVQRTRVGDVLVGAITTDLGVRGWTPWMEGAGEGVAWAGVCETFLGENGGPGTLHRAANAILHRPERVGAWTGGFSAVAWNERTERVAIATGAAQSQTLWCTEGPEGWACGSRARPLLDLVGRAPELDAAQATLFVSFGYLAGTGALFRHVDRIRARHHIALEPGMRPRIGAYTSGVEFLSIGDFQDVSFDDLVTHCAERYAERVAHQYRHSVAPTLSLTGGRDSRSIAAALAHTDFSGPAVTGGRPDAEDVVLAQRVAADLEYAHEREDAGVDLAERLHDRYERALEWSYLNEGAETIRHALHYTDFFCSDPSFPEPGEQIFNGLRPFLNRRSSPGWQREALRAQVRVQAPHGRAALAAFDELAAHIDREVDAAGRRPSLFAELHFWQVKVLHSGQDNILTKDLFSVWWTPLVDATLMRANWALPTHELPRAAFIESLTRALVPRLLTIPFEGAKPSRPARLWKRVLRKLPPPLRPTTASTFTVSAQRRRLWREILFAPDAIAWRDLVEPDLVANLVESDPNAHLLWSLATIELFAQAHLTEQRQPLEVSGSARSESDVRGA